MYCAYITELKQLRKHSNADRLQLGTVFGNTVIVDLSYYEGQKVVFFPVDGQLGEEFAKENNLLRIKNEDGTTTGGYLDPVKRNIKAMRLRGEKSEGLVLPVESLSKWTDINKLSLGDQITVLDGTVICKKYIPRSNHKKSNNGPKVKTPNLKNKFPYFKEHVDTEQLAYNLNAFKPGDTCYITLKMHGCFMKGTKVRMADNSLKAIENIKPGEIVLGYNFQTKKIESTKVLHTFKNAPSNRWNQLKFSRNCICGDKRGVQTSTYNHRYWVEERQEWVMAQDLKIGETVSTLFPSPVLTSLQKEVAIGSFLGDGCLLQFGNKVAEIQEVKKKSHISYLKFLSEITSNWFFIQEEKISGFGSEIVSGKTVRSADLYNYFKDVSTFKNKEGSCRLLEGIIDKITPLSIALWYCGDGSLAKSNGQQDRALLAICRYTEEEDRNIIKRIFNKFSINPTFYKDSKNFWRLRFNLEEANKLFTLIYKYIPPCMQYKIPEEYQNKFIPIKDIESYQPKGYVLSPQKILENVTIEKEMNEYDLETELHNYIVGLTIVHNTSGRTANAIEVTTKKKTLLQKLFHKPAPVIKSWKAISGTRRVVLNTFEGGYYGNDKFRQKYHDYFIDRLPKGMEVFYEIVGWVDGTEQTIMGTCSNAKIKDKEVKKLYGDETVFSYGCTPGTSDIYVYRMTMTNEDGIITEIPWEEVKNWCDRLGVKHVPEFDKFLFTTKEDLMERVEKYYDGPDPIGATHVREGVVIRIDNRSSFKAYKHKNFTFKVLEGLIKDSSDTPDMEEAQEIIEEETV